MKVLLANKFFYLNGGSERVFFQERDFLISQSYRVVDFSMTDARNFSSPYSSFFVPSIDYSSEKGIWNKIKQATSFVHSSIAVKNIERLVGQAKPAIAHLHNIYHQLTPSIISVLKKNGVKVMLTLHDCKLICPSYLTLKNDMICTACEGQDFWKPFTTNCQNSITRGFLLMFEAYWHKWKKSYEFVDLFIAPSQFIADLTSRRIPKSKIKVLHNGIDVSAFKPSYKDEGYGLYIGRISKEKGIETMLKAHKLIEDSLNLKVVGLGPLRNKFEQTYTNAEFLGYKQGNKLNEIISKSAFIIVPSEWYENCSMVVLEAMAMGKPIVGSRIGGIPEQVEDGKTGFLFEMGNVHELADKMMMLAGDAELRQQIGKSARLKAEQEFSMVDHCNKLIKIYNELLSANFLD